MTMFSGAPVPVATALGLRCPTCNTPVEDRIGPFWCPGCPREVSVFEYLSMIFGKPGDDPDG